MQYLASDVANPEFQGAHNADQGVSAIFYSKPMQNMFESKEKGRPIFIDVDMVKIYVPGDDKNVVDTFAREDHKERFPKQWAHYSNKREGDQLSIGRTPLSQWQRLTPAQAEELRALKFFSVDDIANASDTALQKIGMVAGMSPFAFREAAQRFLELADGEAKEGKAAAENTELRGMLAAQQEQMAAMQAKFAELAAAQSAAAPDPLAALAQANTAQAPAIQSRTKKEA